jgi:hypothetical protein
MRALASFQENNMLFRNLWCLVMLSLVAASPMAQAQTLAPVAPAPVAIVEDVTDNVVAVAPLDLLRNGDAVALAPDQGIIISYLDSCQRESIRGGTVAIGRSQSTVTGGIVSRQAVACDATALALTPDQANQSAALAFRLPEPPAAGDPLAASAAFAMSTRHPVAIVSDLNELLVRDLRQPSESVTRQARKGVIELTDEADPLDKGGVYRLEGGGRSLIFRIGREATDAPLPLLKRIIRF